MSDEAVQLAIRSRRALFNRAIEQGDANAIGPLLARDCVMMTGTDSAVISGRFAQVKVWKRDFATANRLIYARQTGHIELSGVEPIAMEYGTWSGAPCGHEVPVGASGCYVAKWRLMESEWVIEAEIYTTLA